MWQSQNFGDEFDQLKSEQGIRQNHNKEDKLIDQSTIDQTLSSKGNEMSLTEKFALVKSSASSTNEKEKFLNPDDSLLGFLGNFDKTFLHQAAFQYFNQGARVLLNLAI